MSSLYRFILASFLATTLTGCSLIYYPSYQLGKDIKFSSDFEVMSKEEVLRTYGSLTVPCQNADNLCYLYTDVRQMKLEEIQMVEFVFNSERQLTTVLYHRDTD